MVLHVQKTLKTTIQKNLKSICDGNSLQTNHFAAVFSNVTNDSEAYDVMKLYFATLL